MSRNHFDTRRLPTGPGVYRISNNESGKFYIGSTVNLRARLVQHIWTLRHGRHHNAHLQSSWDKYGENAFSIEVLCECQKENKLAMEQFYIDFTNAVERGYNHKRKADSPLGVRWTSEMKTRASESHKESHRLRPRWNDARRAEHSRLMREHYRKNPREPGEARREREREAADARKAREKKRAEREAMRLYYLSQNPNTCKVVVARNSEQNLVIRVTGVKNAARRIGCCPKTIRDANSRGYKVAKVWEVIGIYPRPR